MPLVSLPHCINGQTSIKVCAVVVVDLVTIYRENHMI